MSPTALNTATSPDTTLDLVSYSAPATTEVNGHQVNGNRTVAEEYHYPTHVLNQPRSIRIIIIGAGIAGIAGVKLFKERFSGLPVSLTIYEKNADVGGTWLENRYPG
jgi:ribulose 1,5-bisphosphate synthetase/thiazole synthase